MKVLIGGYTKKTSKGIYELPITGAANDARLGKAENIISSVNQLFGAVNSYISWRRAWS